jgi:hypothetical protein
MKMLLILLCISSLRAFSQAKYETEPVSSAVQDKLDQVVGKVLYSRINSQMLARLQDGAKIEPYLHSAEDLVDAVYVKTSIGDMFISFEESALPPNLADIALGEVLEHCMYAIERCVIPVFEKLISNP